MNVLVLISALNQSHGVTSRIAEELDMIPHEIDASSIIDNSLLFTFDSTHREKMSPTF